MVVGAALAVLLLFGDGILSELFRQQLSDLLFQ